MIAQYEKMYQFFNRCFHYFGPDGRGEGPGRRPVQMQGASNTPEANAQRGKCIGV